MLSHVLDVRGPRIDERHVLAGLYHMGAGTAAYRTRSDNGYLPAHTLLRFMSSRSNSRKAYLRNYMREYMRRRRAAAFKTPAEAE
jgi:hypothetical protein